jgi:WD40 repeat protein/tetratricopeptide (TPR) repeat protein
MMSLIPGTRLAIWDLATRKQRPQFVGFGPLAGVAGVGRRGLSAIFSPDGSRLLQLSAEDGFCIMRDPRTLEPFSQLLQHDSAVTAAGFSLDGTLLATGTSNGCVRVWDARPGVMVSVPMQQEKAIVFINFSTDGRHVLLVSGDGTARALETRRGKPMGPPLACDSPLLSAAFSGEDCIVTLTTNGVLRKWEIQTGRSVSEQKLAQGNLTFAEFSTDSTRVLACTTNNEAQVWEVRTGRALGKPMRHAESLRWAHFNSDALRIVTAAGPVVGVWNALTGEPITGELRLPERVELAVFSSDGSRVATASSVYAQVWDTSTGQAVTGPLKHEKEVQLAGFTADNLRLVTASGDLTTMLWDARTGQLLAKPLKTVRPLQGANYGASLSANGARIAAILTLYRRARVWEAETGTPLTEMLRDQNCTNIKFSPDGSFVLICSDRGEVRLWPVPRVDAPVPKWFAAFAEGCVRLRVEGNSLVPAESPESLRASQARLTENAAADIFGQVAEWLVADRGTRTVSPFCDITVPDYVENRIQEGTEESLWEAQKLASGRPEVLARIVEARNLTEKQTTAEALRRQGEPKEAEELFRKILGIQRQLAATNDLKFVRTLTGLAGTLFDQHKQGAAVPFLEEATEILKIKRGPDADETLGTMNNLAWAYADGGRPNDTIHALEELVRLRKSKLGVEHDDTLHNMFDLGTTYCADRRLTNGVPLLEQLYRLKKAKPELQGPGLVIVAENLGSAYVDMERYTNAIPVLDEALKLRRGQSGPSSPNTLWVLDRLAQAELQAERYSDAEALYREALAANRKLWTNNIYGFENNLYNLAEVLQRQGKTNDLERLFAQVVTPELEQQVRFSQLLLWRGRFRARQGRWREASADLARAIELDPNDHWTWYQLAPLLLASGMEKEYRVHATAMLARFGSTDDPSIAERTAKACLLLPVTGDTLEADVKLASRAAAAGNDHPWAAYFQLVQGLAEYRQGRFAEAARGARKALAAPGVFDRDVQAYMVLALACARSGQTSEARAALAQGKAVAEAKLPKAGSGDLGASFHDWLIAHILLGEAAAFVPDQSSSAAETSKP